MTALTERSQEHMNSFFRMYNGQFKSRNRIHPRPSCRRQICQVKYDKLAGSCTMYCSRTLLVQQREQLLASVAGSSVPSVLNLSCQRTFQKPLVISRRGCIQTALNRKAVSSRQWNG
jgi:hypothetical protein